MVALAETVGYGKMRGLADGLCASGTENLETDSQACSADFDKGTETVQGGDELPSSTRAIGHLSKVTEEPQLRLHCKKLTHRKGTADLHAKYKTTTFRKNTKEKLISL